MDADKMCSSKTSKKQNLTVSLQNYAKTIFKRLLKTNLNRPYPNVKIILAYFCIIKTI